MRSSTRSSLGSLHHVAIVGALLLIVALALSGCVHTDRSVTLNGDGTGSYKLAIGFSQQLMSLSNTQISTQMDAFGAKVKQDGGSFRRYDDSGYTYWEYTRGFSSVAQLNQFLGDLPQSSPSAPTTSTGATTADSFQVTQDAGALTTAFHVTGTMGLAASGSTTTTPQLTALLNELRESFSVTMPGWVSGHTGGTQTGNTVTYTIHYGETASINVTGGGYNTRVVYPVAGGAGLLLLLGGGATAGVIWRRRAKAAVASLG